MRDSKRNPDAAERTFLFRLAKDLHMTVRNLCEQMSTREFVEWAAFYSVEAKEEEAAHKRAKQKSKRK